MAHLAKTHIWVKYSPGEKKLFAMLSKDAQSSEELSDKFYNGATHFPFHCRRTIIGLINSIQKKADVNNEPFRVVKSQPRGPYPINVWLEPR
jgi:hypothetical protein